MEKDKQDDETSNLTSYEIDRYTRIAQNNAKLKAKGLNTLVMKGLQKKSDRVFIGMANKNTIGAQPTLSEASGTIDTREGETRKENQLLLQVQERQQRTKQTKGSLPPVSTNEKGAKQFQLQSVTEGLEIQQKKAPKTSKSTSREQIKKIYCSPGSHSQYLRMRQSKASKGNQSTLDKQFGILEEELSLPDDSITESDIIRDLHEGDFQDDASNDNNCVPCEADVQIGRENPDTQKKKCRGRTILADVHTWEKREFIILDNMGQPSGPTKRIVDTFTRFLGTIAKDAIRCPLDLKSWKHVPNKDDIWEYVKKRFDISETGKKFVLAAINADWRTYKSRIKRDHYFKYTTTKERLANRPKQIPENQFSALLKHWDSPGAQKISKINKENREKQSDLHTMGPSSFSMLRVKLREDDPEKKDPSQADVYIKSRKRKVGQNYLTPNEETLQNIEKMKTLKALDDESVKGDPYYDVITKKEHCGRVRLYGRGVTKSTLEKKDSNTSYMLPPIFLESITKKLEKDMDALLQNKIADVISKIREANPEAELNIPSFEGIEGNIVGENDDEVAESTDPTHSEERCS